MATEPAASGLGEALASYQPQFMTAATWGRFRDDAIALTLRTVPTTGRHRRVSLGHLALFLADIAAARPEATLADLLTRDQVDGYLERLLQAGLSPSTWRARRSALIRFLTVDDPRPLSAAEPSPSRPYELATLEYVLQQALADGSPAAHAFARTVVCGLAGHRPPSTQAHPHVQLYVSGTTLLVNGVACSVPLNVTLPPSGRLDRASTVRGRRWAKRRLGFSLELRRLRCNFVDAVVASRPAAEVLQADFLGLEAVTESVRRVEVDEATLASCLRDPNVGPGLVSG